MNTTSIHTQDDYGAVCRRIDEIFQAEPGTPEDDELEILITLVNAYEEKRFPIYMRASSERHRDADGTS